MYNKNFIVELLILLCAFGSVWAIITFGLYNPEMSVSPEPIMIRIGLAEGPCSVNVALEAWELLNQLEIYRWVVACVDSQ